MIGKYHNIGRVTSASLKDITVSVWRLKSHLMISKDLSKDCSVDGKCDR